MKKVLLLLGLAGLVALCSLPGSSSYLQCHRGVWWDPSHRAFFSLQFQSQQHWTGLLQREGQAPILLRGDSGHCWLGSRQFELRQDSSESTIFETGATGFPRTIEFRYFSGRLEGPELTVSLTGSCCGQKVRQDVRMTQDP